MEKTVTIKSRRGNAYTFHTTPGGGLYLDCSAFDLTPSGHALELLVARQAAMVQLGNPDSPRGCMGPEGAD